MDFDRALGHLAERLRRSGVFEMGDGFNHLTVEVIEGGVPGARYVLNDQGVRAVGEGAVKDSLLIRGVKDSLAKFFTGAQMPQQMFLRREVELDGNLDYAQRLWRVFDVVASDFDGE